jgi:1-aminocyclopropane-1-carboxylate deaminase/D-cysteine desulfhydrase-like pyridoxal-dependent ACC family enzyme
MASGSGISALLTHSEINRQRGNWSHIAKDIEVIAVPCVLKADSLEFEMKQFMNSYSSISSPLAIPKVLTTDLKSIPYGKPNKELFEMWQQLTQETEIEFDLTYAPYCWLQILNSWKKQIDIWEDSKVIYVHCGGQDGNRSQLLRYKRLLRKL